INLAALAGQCGILSSGISTAICAISCASAVCRRMSSASAPKKTEARNCSFLVIMVPEISYFAPHPTQGPWTSAVHVNKSNNFRRSSSWALMHRGLPALKRLIGATRCGIQKMIPGSVSSMPFQAEKENHQVDDEQQHNRHFQDQHPAVSLVMIQQLIEIIQGFQFPVHRSVPIAQMKSSGDIFVNACQVPIAEKLADIGQLIAEA